jgi:hypothetical protein
MICVEDLGLFEIVECFVGDDLVLASSMLMKLLQKKKASLSSN